MGEPSYQSPDQPDFVVMVKDLTTEQRKKYRSSEIYEIHDGCRYTPFRPADSKDYKKGAAGSYGKIKLDQRNINTMYRIQILHMTETDAEMESAKSRITMPRSRGTKGNEALPLSKYIFAQELRSLKSKRPSKPSRRFGSSSAVIGGANVLQKYNAKKKKLEDVHVADEFFATKYPDEKDTLETEKTTENNLDKRQEDTVLMHSLNIISEDKIPEDDFMADNIIADNPSIANDTIIADDIEKSTDNTTGSSSDILQKLHDISAKIVEIKTTLFQGFQEIKDLLAPQQIGLEDLNNAVDLMNNDIPVPEGQIFCGDSCFLRRNTVELILKSSEGLQWKVTKLAEAIVSSGEIFKYWLKPPMDDENHLRFHNDWATAIMNLINVHNRKTSFGLGIKAENVPLAEVREKLRKTLNRGHPKPTKPKGEVIGEEERAKSIKNIIGSDSDYE